MEAVRDDAAPPAFAAPAGAAVTGRLRARAFPASGGDQQEAPRTAALEMPVRAAGPFERSTRRLPREER